MQASAGALAHIPVSRVARLEMAIADLQQSGLQVMAATEKGQQTLYQADFKAPTALLLGSEAHGIAKQHLAAADALVKIPMKGVIGSLNVSVAAALLLYETTRQRQSL